MRRLFLASSGVVLLAACGPAEVCPSPLSASFHVRDAPLTAGVPATLELSGSVPEQCLGAFDVFSLTGEVVAPDGSTAPLAIANEQQGAASGNRMLSADLTFEAPHGGRYEVVVSVAPLEAEVRQAVTVALPRPAPRAHLATFPEGECVRPLETSLGTLICDNAVLREGAVVQTLPGFLGIGGVAVWSYEDGRIRRFVDDGEGALEQDPPFSVDAAHPFPTAPGYYEAATETEWVLAHAGDVNRFRVDGSFLREEAELVPFREVLFDGLIRAGTRVVLHSTLGGVRRLCQLEAPPDGPLALAGECEDDERESFYSEPDGRRAWRCSLQPQGLTACSLEEPTAAGLSSLGEVVVSFSSGYVFEPWRGYHDPAQSRGFVPEMIDGALHLEEAVLPEGWSLFGLTPTRIVGQHRTLRQVGLFER